VSPKMALSARDMVHGIGNYCAGTLIFTGGAPLGTAP